MPAMPVAGAHGHVSSPHVVMRAPLPGYGSPTAQMHQAAGMESFMRIPLVDCLNIWSNLCYYYVWFSIIIYYYRLLHTVFHMHWHMLCNVMSWNLIWWDAMRCMHAWTYCIFYDLAQATKNMCLFARNHKTQQEKMFWLAFFWIHVIHTGRLKAPSRAVINKKWGFFSSQNWYPLVI